MRRVRLLTLFALTLPLAAFAEQRVAASLEVTAIVVPNCRVTISPLVFGAYDPLGPNRAAPLDSSADMLISCTRATRASVVLDAGRNGAGGSARTRALRGGDQNLAYEIFRDSARTAVWGEGADALEFLAPSSEPQKVTVYGRIAPAQEVTAGVYADVVTATVDF